MTDKGDNVVPFPNRPNLDPVPSVDAVNRATASQTSRAERDAVVRARADDIRKTVASFSGRISHSHRLVLAGNLGRLLYGSESKRKHGDLSRILQAAGVAEEGDHTKRLPRYAIRPDRSPPSAKTLASRPKNYLLIAEAAANQFGIDRDKSVVLVFSGVQLGGEEPDYDLAEYFSLYRLLNAFLDGIVKTTKVDNYFKSLAKWRWISRTDEYQRAASVAPFSLDEDELDDYGALHPDAVGRWGADVNHFEADSNEMEFYRQRVTLLPKVAISSCSRILMDWDPPFEIKVYPRSVNDGLEIELGSLKVNCLVNIYLVLAPMLPREEVSLYFMRYPMFYVAGNYRLNGELKKLNWYSCPPPNFTFQAGSTSVLKLGFNLNEDTYVVVRHETPKLTADVMYMEKDKYGILHWPLDLVTPSSIVKYLNHDIDVEDGEAGDELATAQSPYKTRAAILESNLRGNWGGEFQKLLIEDVARLLEHMNREIKRLESKSLTEEREALARLVNPATAVPGNKDE